MSTEVVLAAAAGFVGGFIATIAMVIHIGGKAMARSKQKLETLKQKVDEEDKKYAAIEGRLTRIKEIAQLQMDMQTKVDGPQKNSMDGKYKNTFMSEIKTLEDEKMVILKSIIADGFDPSVNILKTDGTTQVTKLSEYLAGFTDEVVPEVKGEATVKQVGKFIVHKGGRDDGGTPTTH